MKKSLIGTFEAVLKEGKCLRIEKLNVSQNDPKYQTTEHTYKLQFMNVTSCYTIESDRIPLNHFLFVPFPEILSATREDLIVGLYFF